MTATKDQRYIRKRLHHEAYTIGWICALPKELTAARAMLDEEHKSLPTPHNNPSIYIFGSIGGHNIVLVCLPNTGTTAAAIAAASMLLTFQSIKFGLIVGIGGGIPPKVKLGDVVVSQPVSQYNGVVQWDMGKLEDGGRTVQTGSLNRPPKALLDAMDKLKGDHDTYGTRIPQYLLDVEKKYPRLAPRYTRSDSLTDPRLVPRSSFFSRVMISLLYILWNTLVVFVEYFLGSGTLFPVYNRIRQTRAGAEGQKSRHVQVHHGLIASGNRVIKDAKARDALDKTFGGHLLCVEMEAAGVMNNFPCIVIRGICDYADSEKNKDWQEYAAAVAAAYAKELLECLQPNVVNIQNSATF
ncbi:purine and uridine phosphorylase [Aspergillus ellipticus CBS 707.79]|uniref:Purine and uridine phosphorylase n=1 Tax=Aspergillus ellipticus CBS 707.79 TaxID=1448320 RepID=A0A319DYC0_9EURO|nr:purine and uridine phosphorylase [Aspergillus ellipticus CBS 707.79]